MKMYRAALAACALTGAVALAGCGKSGDAPAVAASSSVADAAPELPVIGDEVPILALGDSLFAGYGVGADESYPAQLERALRARGINARISNAGVSGNTTADGLQRLAFTLDNQPRAPRLVLISLGGNDMLRGLPPEEARRNLDAILAELDRRGIPAVLMGLVAAPNLGGDYARGFNPIYPELAKKHGTALVPFFLQAVIDKPDLVQPDRVHPTAEGITAIVGATADTVADAVGKLKR